MSDATGKGDTAAGAAPDPTELSRKMADIAERSQRLVADFLSRQSSEPQGLEAGMGDPMAIGAAFFELMARLMTDPSRLFEAQMALWNDYLTLWQRMTERMMGQPAEPVVTPAAEDRRFRDRAWSENAVFDYIKQSYLLTARFIQGAVREVGGLDEHTGRKCCRFLHRRQFVDAMAPSQLRADEPGGAAHHGRERRREPGQRPRKKPA